jgi:hypothetical protein
MRHGSPPPSPPVFYAPGSPTVAAGAPTVNSITLNITAPTVDSTHGAVISYASYYRPTGVGSYIAGPTAASGPITISGLTAGQSYEAFAVAINATGSSPSSNVLTTSTAAAAPPPPPAVGAWGHYDATIRDTGIGLGLDALGRPLLTKDAAARYVFVDKLIGNDAWDGLAPAFVAGTNGPKATKNSGHLATRDGFGDWVLVASGQVFDKGLGDLYPRSGKSAAYPTVLTTYDRTDPFNVSKYRLGKFYWGANLGTDSPLINNHAQFAQHCYFENGFSVVPEATVALGSEIPTPVYFFGNTTPNNWLFYNWSFAGLGTSVQGDFVKGSYAEHAFRCDTTSGDPVLRNVLLTGDEGQTGVAPVVGDCVNGRGNLSAIQFHSKILAYDSVAKTITLDKPCTATLSSQWANSDQPRWLAKRFGFRRVFFGNTPDIAMFSGSSSGLYIEDSVFHRGGFVGKDRNKLPEFELSVNAGAGAGTGTFTMTSAGGYIITVTATSTQGSKLIKNITLLTGDPDYATWPSITGPGLPNGTSVPSFRNTFVSNVRKHNGYLGGTCFESVVRRTVFSRGALTGLQQRGGGINHDCSYVMNPIGFQPGGGDHYWFTGPFGVDCTGGHSVICGSENVFNGFEPYAISSALLSAGNLLPSMSLTKMLSVNSQGAGGLYSRYQFHVNKEDVSNSCFNLSNSIFANWGNSGNDILSRIETDTSFVKGTGTLSLHLVNNQTDGDATWNSFAGSSGNITGPSVAFPFPTRNQETFAISKGFASWDAYMDYAKVNMEVDHALNFNTYMRAGFGV